MLPKSQTYTCLQSEKSNVFLNFVTFFMITFHLPRFSQFFIVLLPPPGEQNRMEQRSQNHTYFRNFHLCRFVGGKIELLPECRAVHLKSQRKAAMGMSCHDSDAEWKRNANRRIAFE